MQLIQLTFFQAFRRSVVMVFQAAPIELRHLLVLTLINGAGPAAVLFLNKLIIDEASRLLRQGVTENPVALFLQEPLLLWSIAGVIVFNLLSDSVNTITNFLFTALRDRIQGFVQGRVLEKVANFDDIALFETPELLNLVQLSEQGVQRMQHLSLLLTNGLNSFFIFVPTVLLASSIAWWVPVVLFTTVAPSIYVDMKYHKQSWEVEATQASTAREMNLYKNVLVGEIYAKEVRLFSLQALLLERWRSLFGRMFREMQQVRRKGTTVVIIWSLVSGLGVALPYIYVVIGALRGIYTLGDLALYAGLILQVRQSLYGLIIQVTDVYDVVLGTTPIFQLLELKPQLRSVSKQATHSTRTYTNHQGLKIKNLSFSYPGSDKKILRDINLTIYPNEMIALVGENGAGKTTLAKLLCRLYDPNQGCIEWNGENLRSLDLDELRSRIGVVMQDYARFPVTVRENVGFGFLSKLIDDQAIKNALTQAGINQVVQRLEQGLETPLGKQLEGGVDLSGGQWQRIAIARALMRLSQAELLLFDEPTAALDPKTEHEIYNIFRTIAEGRIAVVVSHRLALAKLANRVVVLENGKIIETGTHDELMALGGQYHLMFTRQASSYQ